MIKFKLWLEFEQVEPEHWDIDNEFANIHVDLQDGRHYGLNVWTYKFLETSIKHDQENRENLNELYKTPPDLFVKELTRDCIEKAIGDLLKKRSLEDGIKPFSIGQIRKKTGYNIGYSKCGLTA